MHQAVKPVLAVQELSDCSQAQRVESEICPFEKKSCE